MNKVRINQGRLFMFNIRFGGALLSLLLITICFQYLPEYLAIIFAILISMAIPFFWSSYEILEIDPQSRTISEYILIFGRRFQQKKINYPDIDKIFINKVKMGQKMTSYAGKVNTISMFEYHAFLKTTDEKKHFLASDEKSSRLKHRLEHVVSKLHTHIHDNYED